MKKKEIEYEESCGNVFKDLNLQHAEELLDIAKNSENRKEFKSRIKQMRTKMIKETKKQLDILEEYFSKDENCIEFINIFLDLHAEYDYVVYEELGKLAKVIEKHFDRLIEDKEDIAAARKTRAELKKGQK